MAYLVNDEQIGRALDVYGEWAEGELELLKVFLKPGAFAIDAGANIGTHALFFAQAVGPTGGVFAFEPQRVIHQLLCANFALNGCYNTRAFHAAVGANIDAVTVPEIDYSEPGHFGGLALGEYTEGEAVPLLTIDGLDLPKLDLMKIDVEGMEHAALRGATATIKKHKPVIYLEHNTPKGAPEVVSMLTGLGYSLHWHFSPFFRPDNFAKNAENVFGPMVDANVIAVPPAYVGAVASLPKVSGPSDTALEALRRGASR